MKQIQNLSDGKNFKAVNIGPLAEVKDYVLPLAPGIEIPGKVFGGGMLAATGGEFSFQVFNPGQKTGFLHTHKNHEELYFFSPEPVSSRLMEQYSLSGKEAWSG